MTSEISKTADKALQLLTELSDGESATPQQLSRRTEVNRTVVQRLLMTLLARGFVVRNGGEYSLAPRVRRLAEAVAPDLRFAAKQPAAALTRKVSETVVLQVLDDDKVAVLIEEVPSSAIALQVRQEVGSRSALPLSASGLAVLAWLPPTTAERMILAADDPGLADRIAKVRADGFAITSSALRDGVSGLAVPVRQGNRVVASLAVIVPAQREDHLEGFMPDLLRAVKRIEAALT